MLTHCIYYPCYYHHCSQTSARCWMTGNKFKVMTALNNTKWNDYINKWLLIKTRDGKWYFGRLIDYDSDKKTIKLLALINRKFHYIKKDTNSITEAWVVDKWTRFRVGSMTPETFAYVANSISGTISVIDTKTHTVSGDPIRFPIDSHPDQIAITPDGNYAYIACKSANYVYVIDTKTNKFVGSPIYVKTGPTAIAATPDGKYVFVTTTHPDSIYANTVYVIDTKTNKVLGDPIEVGNSPRGVAISPDSKYAYVTSTYPDSIYVINTSTRKVVGNIPVGDNPMSIAITPDGKYAYTTHPLITGDNFVTVVDLINKRVVGEPIIVGNSPQGIAITPNGKYAYVANRISDDVYVIDIRTNKVIGSPIPVESSPRMIAITPDSKYAYVTNRYSLSVSLIDTSNNQVKGDPIAVGDYPLGIAIGQHGKQPQNNWDKYIGYWILFKYANNEWVFGKLINYDSSTNQLRLLALINDKFQYTNESTNNITEIWRADKWTNLTTRTIKEPSPNN